MKLIEIAKRVRGLKIGQQFVVKTERERQTASKVGKSLKDSGAINFDIVTKADDSGGFKIAAI